MRKGFLAAVAATLIAGGTAASQTPYGYPYSPGYGGYHVQPAVYANGYGSANGYGYAPSYGYGYAPANAGYAPQMAYGPSYAYVPGYGYYPMPAGYANTAQAQPPAQATLPRDLTQAPAASVLTNVPEAAESVAVAPAAAPPAVAPAAKVAPQAAPARVAPEAAKETAPPAEVTPPLPGLEHGCCKELCGPPGRIWGSAEYLLWWTRGMNVPPLVTAGPLSTTGPILGAPGTTVLFASNGLDGDFMRSGGRFTLGFWLNECQTKGIEASYFFLESRPTNFDASSSGAPGSAVLGRPFFDTSTGAPGVEFFAFPGFAAGAINVGTSSSFQGAEANGICNLCCGCCYRLDLLAGPRWLQLDESITITENTTVLADPPIAVLFPALGLPVVAGTRIFVSDGFTTRNNFYGFQLGARYERRRGNFYVDLLGKVALGVTHMTLDVAGSTTVIPPVGAAVTAPGGLYALPGNIGHYERDVFSAIPEVDLNVGYQVSNHLRAFVGYTFLYWSDVARPADQINFNVNSTRLPTSIVVPSGPPTLPLTINDTPFWAHGINVGLEFRY